MDPSLAGFILFIQNVMGISVTYLPTTSPIIAFVYNLAINIVNPALQQLPNADPTQSTMYAAAVYNLAGDQLINLAQDQAGQTYFATLRTNFGCNSFVPGVVNSTSDEGTSSSMTVPDSLNQLTVSDLQRLKTPYGRMYLMIAQSYGPSVWGLT